MSLLVNYNERDVRKVAWDIGDFYVVVQSTPTDVGNPRIPAVLTPHITLFCNWTCNTANETWMKTLKSSSGKKAWNFKSVWPFFLDLFTIFGCSFYFHSMKNSMQIKIDNAKALNFTTMNIEKKTIDA